VQLLATWLKDGIMGKRKVATASDERHSLLNNLYPFKAPSTDLPTGEYVWLGVDEVEDNPFQPRTHMTAAGLDELRQSMNAHGQMQACGVRVLPDGTKQLIWGHRRRATVRLGANAARPNVPDRERYSGKFKAELFYDVSDLEMRIWALEENEGEPLTLWDRANAYTELHKALAEAAAQGEPAPTWSDVEKRTKLSYRRMRQIAELMELPEEMHKHFGAPYDGMDDDNRDHPIQLNERHGRALLKLKNQPGLQHAVFMHILRTEMSGSATERMVHEYQVKIPTPEAQAAAERSWKQRHSAVTKKSRSGSNGGSSGGGGSSGNDGAGQRPALGLVKRVEEMNGGPVAEPPSESTAEPATESTSTAESTAPEALAHLQRCKESIVQACRELKICDKATQKTFDYRDADMYLQMAWEAVARVETAAKKRST
jgi:hypothetical protein